MTEPGHFAMFDAPDLPPVLAIEATARGWRGLTAEGELLNVESANGHPVEIPQGSIAVTRDGRPVGYRTLPNYTSPGAIDGYTRCFDSAVRCMRANKLSNALTSIDTALSFAATTTARFNRALILLALGKWDMGFAEFELCELEPMFMRPMYRAAIERGLQPWCGEDIAGRRLLLIHDHGFGDSIMMLRYVPRLRAMGVQVELMLPPELRRLAAQMAPVTANSMQVIEADCFCPLLYLFRLLKQTPGSVPVAPYLKTNPLLEEKWRRVLGKRRGRKAIGLAWTPGKPYRNGDYPRAVPLAQLTRALGKMADLISVQQQGIAEADLLGVEHYQFEDFADCAALMMCLDEIVTIDTAAVHLAGAIGHPCIKLLLPHWSSWRWLSPLYQNIRVYRQYHSGDDWADVLAKLM